MNIGWIYRPLNRTIFFDNKTKRHPIYLMARMIGQTFSEFFLKPVRVQPVETLMVCLLSILDTWEASLEMNHTELSKSMQKQPNKRRCSEVTFVHKEPKKTADREKSERSFFGYRNRERLRRLRQTLPACETFHRRSAIGLSMRLRSSANSQKSLKGLHARRERRPTNLHADPRKRS